MVAIDTATADSAIALPEAGRRRIGRCPDCLANDLSEIEVLQAVAMSMGASGSSIGEMNVTPMIDILLVLLVIFMIIVPQVRYGLQTNVPQPPKQQEKQASQRTIVVQVQYLPNRPPAFKVNGMEMNDGVGGPAAERDLQQELTRVYATRAERVMFVKANGNVDFRWVAEAISIGKAAGANHIGLLTPDIEIGTARAG